MDVGVTDRIYSSDNHDPSLCASADGTACWMAWSAYEAKGSRSFVRFFDGKTARPIMPLSEQDTLQVLPLCVPATDGTTFVWLQKEGFTYSVCCRGTDGDSLSPSEVVHVLPARAKPSDLCAVCDEAGALWLAWAQAVNGRSTIEVIHVGPDGQSEHSTLTTQSPYNYRPRMVALETDGVYLIWDSYVERSYDVYGCALSALGQSQIVRISSDAEWENKSTLCRTSDGALWAVWVRWQDAMYNESVIHQKFSLRGARFDGHVWQPLAGNDRGADIAPLNYGLVTDFAGGARSALGHQGRRLHPMLKAAEDRGVWLFYEAKMHDKAQTLDSKGRLFGLRCKDNEWSEPLNVAEGLVYYEVPRNNAVGPEMFLLAREMDPEHPRHDVDELYLDKVALSDDLPGVPADRRTVNLTGWEEIRLPFPQMREAPAEHTLLPGEGKGRYRLIWGDFHVHSVGSIECEGELDEMAFYARDKACIHALTISDNDSFWNHSVRKNERWLTDIEWDANLGNAKAVNEAGRFALFPGWEETIGALQRNAPSARLLRTHQSVMADDDEMERETFQFSEHIRRAIREGRRQTEKDIVECVRWARSKGYVCLPHAHNNWWRLVDAGTQPACDVVSGWIRYIERWDIYDRYLQAGQKIGFTGSSDAHHRNPGLGGALTGLWVTDITRAAVLEAIRTHRTYATAGQRIVVEFTINDTFMGDVLVVHEDPTLRWRIKGEDEEYILRVHRDGPVIHEERFTGATEGQYTDKDIAEYLRGPHYYYLEVTTDRPVPDYECNSAHALGSRAWTSPIWIETADWIAS